MFGLISTARRKPSTSGGGGASFSLTGSYANAAVGTAYNNNGVTIVGDYVYGMYWTNTGDALPAGLTLNLYTGAIAGTPTVGGVFNLVIRATDDYGTGSTVNYPTVFAVRTFNLTGSYVNAVAGQAYSNAGVTVTGSFVSPMLWTNTGDALPAGLTLNSSTGAISGTTAVVGTFNLIINATEDAGAGLSAVYPTTFTVVAGGK